MSGAEVAVAMALLFVLIIGVLISVVVLVSIASRREDRLFSLTGRAPDAVCRGVRRLVGVGTRGGWPSDPVSGAADRPARTEHPLTHWPDSRQA